MIGERNPVDVFLLLERRWSGAAIFYVDRLAGRRSGYAHEVQALSGPSWFHLLPLQPTRSLVLVIAVEEGIVAVLVAAGYSATGCGRICVSSDSNRNLEASSSSLHRVLIPGSKRRPALHCAASAARVASYNLVG
jgi:hypothetical protein